MRYLAENGLEERALAGAVRPDERRELAAVDVDVDVVKDGQSTDLDREVLDLRAAELLAVGARGGMMMKYGLEQDTVPFYCYWYSIPSACGRHGSPRANPPRRRE